jgi:hypothetical protein
LAAIAKISDPSVIQPDRNVFAWDGYRATHERQAARPRLRVRSAIEKAPPFCEGGAQLE